MLRVRVQPRARKDELVDPEGEHLKVRFTAPPVGGEGNEHLRHFLAKEFGVPQSHVELLSRGQARLKRLRIVSPRKLPREIRDIILG